MRGMRRWIGGVTRTDLTSWQIPNETGSKSRDPLRAKAEVQGSLMHEMFVITLDCAEQIRGQRTYSDQRRLLCSTPPGLRELRCSVGTHSLSRSTCVR